LPAPTTKQRPFGSFPCEKTLAKYSGTIFLGSATANAAANAPSSSVRGFEGEEAGDMP
jgi:hypothetical protein